MNPSRLRSFSATALLAILVFALPAGAAKRRSVAHRPLPQPEAGALVGTIYDAVTGQPVRQMTVNAGLRSDATDVHGRFELTRLDLTKPVVLDTDRSGYQVRQITWQPGTSRILTITVVPTPTVFVRLANGQTLQLDDESLKFGYPVPFSGYRDDVTEDLCKLFDNSEIRVNKSQMKRLEGPAQIIAGGACCEKGNAAKMRLTFRTGEVADVIFTDTCDERYQVDIGARNHVTGEFEHIRITEIAEVVFP